MAPSTAQVTITATTGTAATAVLLFATTMGGMPGAIAAILAMFTAAVTLGLLAFLLSERRGHRASGAQGGDPETCGSCGRRRRLQREVHVCTVCDARAVA
ncbi:MAG TPA: hypothetical protein VLG28_11400 [Acidimicrobiia bacterium]|nr:hypothetical protein [Acidimicrobiia bacterium]